MIYVAICITLLTLIAAMHLLAKVNKENLGSLLKWISYGIIVVCILLVICQLSQGIGRMICRDKEKCGMEMGMHHRMMDGMCHHMMMRGGMGCGNEEMECREGGMMMHNGECGERMGGGGHMKGGCEGMKGGCEDGKDSTHEMHERK